MKSLACCLVFFVLSATTLAAFEQFSFDDETQQARYSELTRKLRCLVCQNQSLSDSNAGLASDLRVVVHDMIKDGASDEEIIDFLLERYGDFILYEPPFRLSTLLLWLGPLLMLLLAFLVLRNLARKAQPRQTG